MKSIERTYAPCGICRELICMVNDKNLDTKVMVAENKIYSLKDLLPEMYITKNEIGHKNTIQTIEK